MVIRELRRALGSPSLIAAVLSSRRTYYCSSACVSQITDEFENTFNPVLKYYEHS